MVNYIKIIKGLGPYGPEVSYQYKDHYCKQIAFMKIESP